MKILLKIAIVAVAAAFMAGCCNCRSYQKKTRRPLAGTEWQLIQLGGKAVKPEEGKFTVTLLAEGNRLTGVGACNRLTGAYKTDGKRTLKIGPLAATMMACPGMDEEEAFTKMLESVTHYDMDAAAVERRRTARRVPGQAMTFRGLIGACVLLTAPAAAFGQKPTAAKQPVAADSAAAQPAEKQPAARIVVFRDSLVLIHCDTPPLFREGDIRTFREWVNEQVRNVRIVIGCPPFPPRVVVSFVIGTTGRLTGIRVLQSPDSKLSAEAVRALESSPHWKPGELYGRKVPVEITIPVDFRSSN